MFRLVQCCVQRELKRTLSTCVFNNSHNNFNNGKLYPGWCRFRKWFVRNYGTSKSKKFEAVEIRLKKGEIRRLLRQAKPERWRLAGAVGFLLCSSAVTMAVPFCIGKVIDIIYTADAEKNKANLRNICGIFVTIFVLGGLANFGRVYLMQTAGQRIIRNLRENVFSSILKQEVAFFDKNKTGELINRLSSDATIVGDCLTKNVSDGLRSLATVMACTSMMIYMSPYLTMVGLCTVPPVAILGISYGRYVRKITSSVQDKLAETTQVAEERIGNIRTVKAFAQEKQEMLRYSSKLYQVLRLQYKEALAMAAFFGMAGVSGNLVVLTVLYYGGTMMADNQITVGELSAFLLYAAYMGVSLGGLSSFYSELMRGIGASTKLWDIIDRASAVLPGALLPSSLPKGTIEYSNVNFAYPTRSKVNIFKDLNLLVPAGSVTAVVGSSGSGKSTLASLLLRFYDPQSGSILLDGTDVRNIDVDWLRSHIGIVSQEPILFSSSIRDNVLYGAARRDAVSEDVFLRAVKDANAYQFINEFPDKFDTVVGEKGVLLSGGQKQRIAIARAIVKDPRILILDEATSALDAESESLVQDALDRLMKGRTVIIIAHRLSTIKHADDIAVFHGGAITEKGSYKELMELDDGMFRKLIEKQTVPIAIRD